MNILLIMWSPIIAAVLCLVIYAVVCARKSLNVIDYGISFIAYVVLYGLLGFLASIVIVFALTAIYNSPQGPLILIVYGPIGTAVGQIIGISIWVLKKSENKVD